jgi:CheY-like chemotaxis protein
VVFVCSPSPLSGKRKFTQMAANILVVEDDSLNRDLICKVLRQEGHGVVEACFGGHEWVGPRYVCALTYYHSPFLILA